MTWPKDAYVGQKVVCIDDKNVDDLQLNNIYIIEKIYISNNLYFWLQGVNDRSKPNYGGYYPRRFRPVQTNEKGMEMLRELLNPINHKVLEGV